VPAEISGGGFSDSSIRKGFIRKVLGIILCQLLLSAIFILLAVVSSGYRNFL
jgi:FtsH-binding integral membrane protein